MLIRTADLKALAVKTADGKQHKVEDLLTEDGIALQRVLVDFSGWVERHRTAVPIRRFSEPDLENGTWTVSLAEEDLAAREGAGDGPFGHSITNRLGARVFDTRTEIGTVLDLVYSTEDWHPDYLVVQIGEGLLPEDQKVIPASKLAAADWQKGEVRLAVAEAEVRDGPSLHEAEMVRGNWMQNVLAYYGIQ
jgi:hypothetical protein